MSSGSNFHAYEHQRSLQKPYSDSSLKLREIWLKGAMPPGYCTLRIGLIFCHEFADD